MPRGRRLRRVLLASGLVVTGLLGIWFSLPLWFPWLLRPLARQVHARFADYQREGYGRFSLYGVTYTNRAIRFKAQHIEGLTPTVWLARLATGAGQREQPFVSFSGWQLEFVPSARPAGSVYSQAQGLPACFRFLQRWAPQVVLSNGIVRVEPEPVQIPALTWSNGQLWARIRMRDRVVVMTANVSHAPAYQLQLSSDSLHLESSVHVSANAAGLSLQSTNQWWNNPVELEAQFGRAGQLPELASVQARNFRVPAQWLQLPGYGAIRGSAAARWEHGRFDLDLSAEAHPLAARTKLPPLTLDLHAHGNTNRTVLDTAVLSSPWLRAELSRELAIHFKGGLLRQPASLKLTADLARQPWLPLEGKLNGGADFSPSTNRFPVVRFRLSGAGFGTPQLKAQSFSIAGGLDWRTLNITNMAATFEDGSTASASGEVALEQRRVESGRFVFSGPLARRWLPAGYSYQDLAVAGQFEGAFTNLSHSGHLAITHLVTPELRPLDLTVDWQGRQQTLSEAKAEISAGGASLQVEGAAGIEDGGGTLRLDALTVRQGGKAMLSLAGPARVSYQHSQWRIDPLVWAGVGGQLKVEGDVDWPLSGRFKVSAQGLRPDLAQDFLKAGLPAVELGALNASADWSNGPVKFGLEVSAAERSPPAPGVGKFSGLSQGSQRGAADMSSESWSSWLGLGGEVKLTGDDQGISVQQFELTSQSAPLASLHGFIPVTLNPAAPRDRVRIEPEGPLSLSGVIQAPGVLRDKLTAWTGVRWHDPHLRLDVSGTPKEPQGQIQLQAQQIELVKSRQPLPALTDLRLDLRLDRRQARLADCRLLVQGQPVTLTGEVPLGAGFWANLKTRQLPDWEKASAHLHVARADLEAFADLCPKQLSPQGELEANISLLPGFKLDGYLKLQGGRTQPLPIVGPVRDITVNLRFQERAVEVQSATANVGGAIVRAGGQANLGDTNWLAFVLGAAPKRPNPGAKARSTLPSAAGEFNWLPPFSFSFVGTNVPLARQPEAIVRGDLDLAVTRTNGALPLVSGVVHLHDSYFLSDLTALIPGKIETPSQRPPYFSITNALVADWRLGVKVTGDRFLKARTELFNGEVSANVKLEGTLADPVAVGDLRVDSGIVRFPFGSLEVQQGFVALTSENRYHPQISVSATSKQFGYDVNMQVSGTANAAVVQFSSNPPLSSEQVLLLLTAGELPQGAFSLTPQQRAQTLAMFLGRDLLSKLGFAAETDQRLMIHSGEQIAETGKPTYSIEFKLTDTVSLVGEYDEFGDYNAGVQWRIYSK